VVYVSVLQYFYLFLYVTLVCQHVFHLPHSAVFNTSYLLREVSQLPICPLDVYTSWLLSYCLSSRSSLLLPPTLFCYHTSISLYPFPPLFISPPTFLSFSTQSSPTLLYPTRFPSPLSPPPFHPPSSPFPPLPSLLSYIISY
jgi:hypothetical protein